MDKEPTLTSMWAFFLILAAGGYFLARKHPIFLLPVLFFVGLFASLIISEINDPHVGPAIVREAGAGYAIQSYFAIGIGTIVPLSGAVAWFLKPEKQALQ